MALYYTGIIVCLLMAIGLFATVNWYTALPPLGIALTLYFLGMDRAAREAGDRKNAR